MFLFFSFKNGADEANQELELLAAREQTAQQVATQLRGGLPPEVSNEQIRWYNAGRASLIEDMRKGYRELKSQGKANEFWFKIDVDGEEVMLRVE